MKEIIIIAILTAVAVFIHEFVRSKQKKKEDNRDD